MEALFTTQLSVKERKIPFRVVFDQEEYIFHPEQDGASRFSMRREHDEWQANDRIPEDLKAQAVEALERYLLKQH